MKIICSSTRTFWGGERERERERKGGREGEGALRGDLLQGTENARTVVDRFDTCDSIAVHPVKSYK